jgi:spore coat polysaccharide biosynthesis predicted glycosyltransferase SpsG
MGTRSRILFRAHASHELGFGHVARLCALIEEAESQGYETIAMFSGDAHAIRAWAYDRKLTIDLREWSPTQVVQACEDARVRAMFVDGPELAPQVIPKLPDRVRGVILDDGGKSMLAVATVVNHNAHAPALAAGYPLAKQRLLGRRYLMLRKDIRRYTRGSCRPTRGPRLRVLVTFGGSDPVGATARALTLIPPDRSLELVVIAGPGFRDDDALKHGIAVATAAGHTVDLRRSPDDPGALFVSADAAISSAGGTLGELAFLGCPALAYAIVRDQVAPARYQVREGLISGGRNWQDSSDDMLRSDMLAFLTDDDGRAAQRQRALATADADGAHRIIEEALS